ncbi:MAG: hypothetical protein Q9212_006626 [Teloschistes hypoglaucus]
MEALIAEHEKLSKSGTLSESLDDIQRIIDILVRARETAAASPEDTSVILTKLQNPVKSSFEDVRKDLEDVRKQHNKYAKLLDKVFPHYRSSGPRLTSYQKFKDKVLPQMEYDALSSQPARINRAIAMHLLREGQFSVASTFLTEATRKESLDATTEDLTMTGTEQDVGLDTLKSEDLRKQFGNMYYILHQMKNERNLLPAIEWAREKRAELAKRVSNLEFELGKLQFIWLFIGPHSASPNTRPDVLLGRQRALDYARSELSHFRSRYFKELRQLCGAIAFCPNLEQSPYRRMFINNDAWDQIATAFTKEFCSLLGLSADSPLYIAATAGAIALPHFSKLEVIMKAKGTEWTTEHEIPVEVPLPPSYRFHSIFVCPVSKEQTTDQNPPMMMPCGHVVAQESLLRLSKNSRFKCPYCPTESHPRDAMELYM